jgi:hypothetical protein
MVHVVFVAPFALTSTMRFASALAGLVGVRLTGIFMQRPSGPAADLFTDHVVVADVFQADQITAAAQQLSGRHGRLHRLIGVLEELQLPLAFARRQLDLPGITPEVAHRFRDKAAMKEVLIAAGIPTARHATIIDPAEAWRFVDEVGYPMVLKPPAGAGCRATVRVSGPQELADVLRQAQPAPGRPLLAEEFLTGAEHSFETLTLNGEVKFSSIGRYYPSPLEVMEKPWLQWVVILPRENRGPLFDEAREMGCRAISALGLGTSITHMEWFRRPDGRLAVGEIAARPPGARIVDLMSAAYDRDMHRAWAELMVYDAVQGAFERSYASGVAFLRGAGQGRVAGVEGIEDAQRRMGEIVVDAQLPVVGAPRRSGYEGEGFALVRHPDTDVVKSALFELITTVQVRYR